MNRFISDLHLDESRPQITALWRQWMADVAGQTRSLYILGDLFEAYIGDDDDRPLMQDVAATIGQLTRRGAAVHFLAGNRDFLLGEAFATRCGMHLLEQETVVELDGIRTLLMHGDTLCTDDLAYQAVRQQIRHPAWITDFLQKPIAARRAFAAMARGESAKHTAAQSMELMDANPTEVDAAMARHGVRRLIHGHTHRPAIHNGKGGQRIVLGDWYTQGSALCIHGASLELQHLPG